MTKMNIVWVSLKTQKWLLMPLINFEWWNVLSQYDKKMLIRFSKPPSVSVNRGKIMNTCLFLLKKKNVDVSNFVANAWKLNFSTIFKKVYFFLCSYLVNCFAVFSKIVAILVWKNIGFFLDNFPKGFLSIIWAKKVKKK